MINPRIKPKTCVTCGAGFIGGPTAIYCPACRAERIRERDRRRTETQRARSRKIGSTDLCQICGQQYEVRGGQQKYCPACQIAEAKRRRHESWRQDYSDPEKRRKIIDKSRQWALEHPERMADLSHQSYERNKPEINDRRRVRCGYKLRPLGRVEVCPKCGQEFTVKERNQRYCDGCRRHRRKPAD